MAVTCFPRLRLWVVGAVVALVSVGCGEDSDVTSPASTSTSIGASTTSDPSTTTTTGAVVEVPATAVAATWDGELVVVRTTTGEHETVIDDRYSDLDLPASEGGHWFVSQIVLDGQGRVVVETCCEPAAGHIGRYEIAAGAEEEPLVDGVGPSLSPDASTLAFGVIQFGVGLVEPPSRQPVRLESPEQSTAQYEATTWLGPGTLAYTEVHHQADASRTVIKRHELGSGDLADDEVLVESTEPRIQLATRHDGALVWASTDVGVAHVIDPDTGEEVATFDLGGPIADIAYDATGTWLLVVGKDGELRWFGGGRSGTIPGRYTAAAW